MRRVVFLIVAWTLTCPVFSQVDTSYIYNTSMPYGTLDLRIAKSATRYYYLQENVTFSYRESSPGVKTNTYKDMTASWNSSPYGQGNMRERNGSLDNFVLNYRILFPQGYDPTYAEGYPIIMMLHGAGETGNCWGNRCHWQNPSWDPNKNDPAAPTDPDHALLNNDRNLFHGGQLHLQAVQQAGRKLPNDPTLNSRAFPGILVFPQSLNGWSQPARVEEAIKLMRLIIKKYNVDENRVYLHGLSNGGWGVNQAIKRAPWLFACALNMSGVSDAEIPTQNINEVSKLPLWIFQGGQDTGPTPSKTFSFVKKLRNAGAVVRYYLYPTLGHGTWNTAYKEPDFFTWILSQKKTQPHVSYGSPFICKTNGAGAIISFSKGFKAYQWEKDGVLLDATSEQITATQTGTYRGRFSRKSATPSESEWEPWSDPVVISELNPAKPEIIVNGTTHLRGPGLASTPSSNTVVLKSSANADLYDWIKNGQVINFPETDADDTLKTVTLTSGSTASNGVYTLVTKTSYCPSPVSDPVYLFFNNSAPQQITLNTSITSIAGSSSVLLNWKDQLQGETGYEIWRRKQGTADFVFAGRTTADAGAFQDKRLEPGTFYEYKLRAISNTGRSNYMPSDNLTINHVVKTLDDKEPPAPPQQLSLAFNTINSVTVRWTPAVDDNGIKEYRINVGQNVIVVPGNTSSYTITNLQANTDYPISVVAVDYGGHASSPSNQIVGSTFVSGLWYKHSTGVWTDLDDTTLVATFKNPEFTGHVPNFTLAPRTQEDYFNFLFSGYFSVAQSGDYVFRITSDDGSRLLIDSAVVADNDGKHGNRTVTTDTLFLVAGPHSIEVQYFDYEGGQNLVVQYKGPGIADGNTFVTMPNEAMSSGTVPPRPLPAPPVSLIAAANGMDSVQLSWTPTGTDYTHFEIYRSTGASTAQIVGSIAANQFLDTLQLIPGTTYTYKVRAVNATGASGFSNEANAVTRSDDVPPSVPMAVSMIDRGHDWVSVQWQKSNDNHAVAGYVIYVNGIATDTTNMLGATIVDLENIEYLITVRAFDEAGLLSPYSAQLLFDNTIAGLYHSLPTGDLNLLTSWSKHADGSGAGPANFSDPNLTLVITNRENATLNTEWSVSGLNSKIIVDEGTSLALNAKCNCTVELRDGSTLVLNTTDLPNFGDISPTSTIEVAAPTQIPDLRYGTLRISGTGLKAFAGDTTTIDGDLSILPGVSIAAAPVRHVVVGGSVLVSDDNASSSLPLHLIFRENAVHNLRANRLISIAAIEALSSATVELALVEKGTLKVGHANGGGIILRDGSRLKLGTNNLALQGGAMLNPNGESGVIAFENDSLQIETTSTEDLHLRMDSSAHATKTLVVQLDGAGKLYLYNKLIVANELQLKNGELLSNGALVLAASSSAEAFVPPMASGRITGNVIVQDYYAAGANPRRLALPVAQATVAQLQRVVPVTGSFTGSSPSPDQTPSLHRSAGDYASLVAFPPAGSSNQAVFEVGRGYLANFGTLGDTSAVTLTWTGTLNQGNISIPLDGGNGTLHSGWNLVANPYPAEIILDQRVAMTSLGPIVAVRENAIVEDGRIVRFRYHDLRTERVLIKRGESFWIQATNGSPTLTLGEQNKATAATASTASSAFTIRLTQGAYFDEAYLTASVGGSDAYQPGSDFPKLVNSGTLSVATVSEGESMAYNDIAIGNCGKNIPIDIGTLVAGSYQLAFRNTSALGNVQMKLWDAFKNIEHPVAESMIVFEVTADPSSYGRKRFSLVIAGQETAAPSASVDPVCTGQDAIVKLDSVVATTSYAIVDETKKTIAGVDRENKNLVINKSYLHVGNNAFLLMVADATCSDTLYIPLNVMVNALIALTTAQETVTICKNSDAQFSVDASPEANTFRWYSDGELIGTTSTGLFELQGVSVGGNITVNASNDGGCASDTLTITYSVVEGPDPQLLLSGDTLHVDVVGKYEWSKDGSFYQNTDVPFIVVADSGLYQVNVITAVCAAVSNEVLFVPAPEENPGPENPDPENPDPVNPDPADPDPANPDPANPDPANPDTPENNVTATLPAPDPIVSLEIYPNPNDGRSLHVRMAGHRISGTLVTITDSRGVAVMHTKLSGSHESIHFDQALSPGMYLLHVTNGRERLVRKFIVEK